jgi:hypothetical protein
MYKVGGAIMKKRFFSLAITLLLFLGVFTGTLLHADAAWTPAVDYESGTIVISGADSSSIFTVNGITYPQGTSKIKILESWYGTEVFISDNSGFAVSIKIKANEGSEEPDTNDDSPDDNIEGYTDVDINSWYYGDVSYVKHTGLMPGRSADTFEPDAFTTREEVAAILYNIAGEEFYPSITNSFADIPEVADCLTAILWGVEYGIVNGKNETTFGFGESVTREQLAAFFYRLAGHLNYDTGNKGDISTFDDAASVSSYATEEIAWAIGDGLMNGVGDNKLAPQGTATRAQVAAMVQRFMKLARPYF